MELSHHPEYPAYLDTLAADRQLRQTLPAWQASGQPLPAGWTADQAADLTRRLASFFTAYNRVLWEAIPLCRPCGGQCCGVHCAHVSGFDLLALALLGLPFPARPQRLPFGSQSCIYQDGSACAWPDGWRTLKCWAFYCLGPAPLRDNFTYPAIAARLRPAVAALLPPELLEHDSSILSHLDNPLALAASIGKALDDLLVIPLARSYGLALPPAYQEPAVSPAAEVEAFFAAVHEALAAGDPLSAQLLSDLEQLEWIVAGQPAHRRALLNTIAGHYPAPATDLERRLLALLHSQKV